MATNDTLKRLIDAGMSFTQMSQSRAESIVNDLVKQGEVRKKEAQKSIDSLVQRGKESSERLIALIQHEVGLQVGKVSSQVEALEHRIEDLAKMVGLGAAADKVIDVAESAADTVSAPVKAAGAKVSAAVSKASPVKKTAAKKSAPVKAGAKKAAESLAKAAVPVEAAVKKVAAPVKKVAAPVKKVAANKSAPVTAATKKVALGKRPAKKSVAPTAD